jgi:hypothetical protein
MSHLVRPSVTQRRSVQHEHATNENFCNVICNSAHTREFAGHLVPDLRLSHARYPKQTCWPRASPCWSGFAPHL